MTEDDCVRSSGNVFADMELEDADELLVRAQLGAAVREILETRGESQRDLGALLGIDQAEVSKLMRGKYHLFSEGRLLGFLGRLDRKVVLHIEPRQRGDRLLELV
jgi:predicted XRE-type DNA-binding protein